MHLHRIQVEYELREKLVLLRQRAVLATGDQGQSGKLMVQSVSSFATLFRHALIALGHAAPDGKREAVDALAAHVGFDATPIRQLLDVREHKTNPKDVNVAELFASYLRVIEQVAKAVDEALSGDSPAQS